MADLPDYAILYNPAVPLRFSGYRHRLMLRPDGVAFSEAPVSAAFLIDADCGFDVLNSPGLAVYIKQRVLILIQAQRAKDLRPFLRRSESFRRRGFVIEVQS